MIRRALLCGLTWWSVQGAPAAWTHHATVATNVTPQTGQPVALAGDGGTGLVCGWVCERAKGLGQELWLRRGGTNGFGAAECVEDCERGAWLAAGATISGTVWLAARGPWNNPVLYRRGMAPLTIVITTQVLHDVDDRLFGEFLEHPTWGSEGGIEAALIPGTHELQPGVLDHLKAMHIPLLRFPAGTDVDFMDWTDMIDHVPSRTNTAGELLPRPATCGFNPPGDDACTSNYFGYDELHRLCTALVCQTVLPVNFRDALLKLRPLDEAALHAAGLAAYCNAATNAALPAGMPNWPAVRALNGSPAPYGAKYFQLGNETWWYADDPWWYAQCVTAYVARLREVAPEIEILVDAVTPTQVAAVAALAGTTVQYLVQHEYLPQTIENATLDRWGQAWTASKLEVEDVWYAWVAAPNQMTAAGESGIDNLALQLAPQYGYKAAMTEWNWAGGWHNAWGAPLDSFWARGLGAAGFLHAMLRAGDRMALACQSLAVGNNWPITAVRVSATQAFAPFFLPCGQAVMLYAQYHGTQRVAVEMRNAPAYAQPFRMNMLTAKPVVATLDTLATVRDDAVFVHCINRHFSKDIDVELDLRAWPDVHSTGLLHRLESDVLDWYYPQGPAIASVSDEGLLVSGGRARITVPRRSVTIVALPRGAAAPAAPTVWHAATASTWQTELVPATNPACATLSAASAGDRCVLAGCTPAGLSVWETTTLAAPLPAFTNVAVQNPPSLHAVTATVHMDATGRVWLAVCLTNAIEPGAWLAAGRETTAGSLEFEWWFLGGGGPPVRQIGLASDAAGVGYVAGISAAGRWVVYDSATGAWRATELGLANTGTPCATVGCSRDGAAWLACAARCGQTNAWEIWHNAFGLWTRDTVLTSSVSAVAHGYGGVAGWGGFVASDDTILLGVAPAQTRTFDVYQRPALPEGGALAALLAAGAWWLRRHRRVVALAALAAAAAGITRAENGVRQYCNPLGVVIADPFVLYDHGVYYLYGTTRPDGFEVHTSRDLVNWRYGGHVYRATRASWPESAFWAPEVVRKNTNYFMFYCARGPAREPQRITARLCVARAASPTGPFADVRAPAFDLGYAVIDPHVWFDKQSNAWLFFTRDCSEAPRSEIWAGPLTDDLLGFKAPPRCCFWPSQPWEGTGWNEAPFVLAHGNLLCAMYSANYFADVAYSVGVALATNPMGPWVKAPYNPILRARDNVWGPGHHCVIPSPDGREQFIVYHRQVRPNYALRQLAIDRLTITDDDAGPRLVVHGPTTTPQNYPSGAPPFPYGATDHFSAPALDRARWLVFNEQPRLWSLRRGALHITATDGDVHRERFDAANIFLQYLPPGDCIIETCVDVAPERNYEQAFLCVWQDADNFVRLAYAYANGLTFEAAQEVRGDYRTVARPAPAGRPVTLQIARRGTRYQCRARAKGSPWQELGGFDAALAVPQMGLGAIAPVSGRPMSASFDYVRLTPRGD